MPPDVSIGDAVLMGSGFAVVLYVDHEAGYSLVEFQNRSVGRVPLALAGLGKSLLVSYEIL